MLPIIVVDDHRLFRIGIRVGLSIDHADIQIVGEAGCGEELFSLMASTHAEVILLDINLPDIGGVAIAHQLRRDYPAVKILAVSAENSSEIIQAMLEAGIDGFVSKEAGDMDELAHAIRTVACGLEYFGRDIASIIFGVYVMKKKSTMITNEFTDREHDIIIACRDGLMGKEIAERLGVSINTINTHKKRIFQKLGINTTIEMVQYALKKGIIRIEN
jgi:DNA-binding NarL/FixJ family response regulator